jgi:recombination protein RecT
MTTQNKKVPAIQKDISNDVLNRINQFREAGELFFPKNYSPENAIKSAMLILQETKTKDDKPVLEYCTRISIANALLEMVITGLSAMKKQCDFIAYGRKLTMQREYHGTIALAKRLGGVKEANANIIYDGDIFKYEVDPDTGKKIIIEHTQEFKNINDSKIIGAYAVLTFEDKEIAPYVDIMNIDQIRKAWAQGATKGQSPAHRNFPGEMAKKSVISRACKLFITSSDDSNLALAERIVGKKEYEVEEGEAEEVEIQKEIEENANSEDLDFEEELNGNNDNSEPEPGTEKRPESEEKREQGQQFKADF